MTGIPNRYTKHLLADRILNEGFEIGDHTYGMLNVHSFNSGRKLKVGRYTSIAGAVHVFLGGNHRIDWATTYPFTANLADWPEAKGIVGHPSSNGDVSIGSDVWIGSHVMIMSGIDIGHGAVVATGAIVTKNVPPYAIVGGNPAKVIKIRFSESVVDRLLATCWWERSDLEVRQMIPFLLSSDINRLLDYLEAQFDMLNTKGASGSF